MPDIAGRILLFIGIWTAIMATQGMQKDFPAAPAFLGAIAAAIIASAI